MFDKGINTENIKFYSHFRNEDNKVRELVTLRARERLYSSLVIKKIAPLFSSSISENSFGYQINENFKDGYIFKPWLYQWIKFLSGISQIIDEEANKDFYIVYGPQYAKLHKLANANHINATETVYIFMEEDEALSEINKHLSVILNAYDV